jgi:hypothetical protein
MNIRRRKASNTPAVYRRFAKGVIVFFTIAVSQVAAAQQDIAAAADTSLLSAILRAAISDAGRQDLRVDPRPLVAFPKRNDVHPAAIAEISSAVTNLRTAIISAAGLRTVDAVKVGQTLDCRGIFAIGATDSLGHSYHAGCPTEAFDVLAIALPRPGCDVLPGDEVYDRDTERAARGYWAARVIRTSVGSGGSVVYSADYVLAKRAGSWEVIKIVGLMYLE